ncbi:MAG: hypothetical protein Q9M39_02405 [Sulfurovum sp.]|nr:hypothetical protein [Sulfurovum sp.]
MKEMSILDLKAHYHGLKYVKEVFKLLPNLANELLWHEKKSVTILLQMIKPLPLVMCLF